MNVTTYLTYTETLHSFMTLHELSFSPAAFRNLITIQDYPQKMTVRSSALILNSLFDDLVKKE